MQRHYKMIQLQNVNQVDIKPLSRTGCSLPSFPEQRVPSQMSSRRSSIPQWCLASRRWSHFPPFDSRDLKLPRAAGCREPSGRYGHFSVLPGSFVCALGGRLSRLAPFCAICQEGPACHIRWGLPCDGITYTFTAHPPPTFANTGSPRHATNATLHVKSTYFCKKNNRKYTVSVKIYRSSAAETLMTVYFKEINV